MDLAETTWRIVSVDGLPVASELEAELRFVDRDEAAFVSSCGEVIGNYFVDTDSDQLEFGDFAGRIQCRGGAMSEHERVLDALRGTEGWQLNSEESVELVGQDLVELSRESPGSSN